MADLLIPVHSPPSIRGGHGWEELIGNRKLKMFKQENGGVDMCKAFEDEREEGRLEGEETLRQAIANLMKNLKMSFTQAVEALGIPKSEWEKYRKV